MPKRASVAFVACNSCRRRKVRCDGILPVCGACLGRDTSCSYTSDPTLPRATTVKAEQEELQTKYNNLSKLHNRLRKGSEAGAYTLLERIRREESPSHGFAFEAEREVLVDSVASTEPARRMTASSAGSQARATGSLASVGTVTGETHLFDAIPSWNQHIDSRSQSHQSGLKGVSSGPANISASHRVMLWPAVNSSTLPSSESVASDLRSLATIGSPWFLAKDRSRHERLLPCDEDIPHNRLPSGAVIFPELTVRQVDVYSAAYFNTFNRLYPLLDPDTFMDRIVSRLLREGYRDDDSESVLALLVFALGHLAHDGVLQHPARVTRVRHSGFRGGSIKRPPGLGIFNEARRRLGLIATQCNLENVQILLLQATYFEACARHSDFWTSISAASMSCMFLMQSRIHDWSSQHGDLVKRAFWICLLHERSFNLEFGVVTTGIEALADSVPMPHFPKLLHRDRFLSDTVLHGNFNHADSHYAYHFSAMISLSRLLRRAYDMTEKYEPFQDNDCQSSRYSSSHAYSYTDDGFARGPELISAEGIYASLPPTIQALILELDTWYSALPQRLKWEEGSRFDFTRVDSLTQETLPSFFSFLQDAGPDVIDHNTDIAVAHLRSCFYQARFLIHRPFIYKALHDRDRMTLADRKLCAIAINSACLWPISLSPPSNKKHLIPHLFSWTQNFLAMLLVLRICQRDHYMAEICREGNVTGELLADSISSMKAWLEDVSQVDGLAEWSLELIL